MTVYLVGAGPGNPDLLTYRAMTLLARADVILHDRLIDGRVFDLCAGKAILVDVGKTKKTVSEVIEQDNINSLLIDYGRKYKTVVRLKGGDPFIFGRGGEEAIALERAGVDFEVIPGISSALAAPLLAGIPLTHRGTSRGVAILTGHELDDEVLQHLVKTNMTMVIMMGVAMRQSIADKLQAAGLSGDCKVAICQRSSTVSEVNQVVSLADLGETDVESPAIFVIGKVVELSLKRKFPNKDKPLYGQTVVVTRGRHQAGELGDLLQERGAKVIFAPTIAIMSSDDLYGNINFYLDNLSSYGWIVFTSSNTVESFFQLVQDVRILHGVKIAAIGSETASKIRSKGIVADLIPTESSTKGLLDEFAAIAKTANTDQKILIPRSAIAKKQLSQGLENLGFQVDTVEAYHTLDHPMAYQTIEQVKKADIVTFTSPSTVHSFVRQVGKDYVKLAASIGRETTSAIESYNITSYVQAQKPTMADLVDVICKKVFPL